MASLSYLTTEHQRNLVWEPFEANLQCTDASILWPSNFRKARWARLPLPEVSRKFRFRTPVTADQPSRLRPALCICSALAAIHHDGCPARIWNRSMEAPPSAEASSGGWTLPLLRVLTQREQKRHVPRMRRRHSAEIRGNRMSVRLLPIASAASLALALASIALWAASRLHPWSVYFGAALRNGAMERSSDWVWHIHSADGVLHVEPLGSFYRWDTPYWKLCLLFIVLPCWRALRRYLRRRDDHPGDVRCSSCGYNLTGNLSGICPECGTAVPTTAR